jgi:4-hydroxybenzoate polyprenyltransferase
MPVKAIVARLDAYERLVRLDKPIGILLLLWPTLSALWLAALGSPPWSLVLIFTMGTILMRSAGCAVNDWADRRFDAHVKRTASRPLATGEIPPWEALAVGAALALCAFLLVLATNRTAILLSLPALRSRSRTRSSSASSSCRRRFSASRSPSAFRWRTPRCSIAFRRSPGGCCC